MTRDCLRDGAAFVLVVLGYMVIVYGVAALMGVL